MTAVEGRHRRAGVAAGARRRREGAPARGPGRPRAAPLPPSPSPAPFPFALLPPPPARGGAAAGGEEEGAEEDDVLVLPGPEWVANALDVTGPAGLLADFRRAARGAGIIPWRAPPEEAAEGLAALLAAAGGLAGPPARRLAAALAAAAAARREAAAAAAAVPLCLHALLPAPPGVLALGPDHPRARRWLWAHWGTAWPLRAVEARPLALPVGAARRGHAGVRHAFLSADWSPWPALRALRARWPGLRLDLRPGHGAGEGGTDDARPGRGGPPPRGGA